MRSFIKITLFSFFALLTLSTSYVKYTHSIDTGARCLDGTPAALYVSEGSKDNILVFFIGGGFCEGVTLSAAIDSCYKRSDTDFGSSKGYADTVNYDDRGILSTRQQVNPNFWNWTKVYIPYCDGSLHQGSRLQPISYKDKSLYFRGTNNTLQHFAFLEKNFNLYKASKIVVTGISAGAVATLEWSNYIYERSETKNVYAIPDSGIFVSTFINPFTDRPSLLDLSLPIMSIVNSQIDMPLEECMRELGDNAECFLFSKHPQYQKAPLFLIESQYDQFCISHILTLLCQTKKNYGAFSLQNCNDTERSYIESYRNTTIEVYNNFSSKLTNFGLWAPACVQHGFTETTQSFVGNSYKVPAGTGVTVSDAIAKFMKNINDKKGNSYTDTVQWPNNSGCSAYSHSRYLREEIVETDKIIQEIIE